MNEEMRDGNSDDAASVKRATTLNPTTLTSNFLHLADEKKKAQREINIQKEIEIKNSQRL